MKKYKHVYDYYRNAILDGYLKKEDTLPSIRKSCEIFQCSQTTIEHAYEQIGRASCRERVCQYV